MKKQAKRYIAVTRENREFLAKTFHVTESYVWMCLHFTKNGGKAEKIRYTAIKRGGVAMVSAPEVETLFDADGYMRQYFPNGVMLEVSKEDGHGDVIKKGEVVRHYDLVMVNEISAIQEYAQSL